MQTVTNICDECGLTRFREESEAPKSHICGRVTLEKAGEMEVYVQFHDSEFSYKERHLCSECAIKAVKKLSEQMAGEEDK